ncbi:MAG: hypothetical protein AMXMBFR83_02140 [Phycisphaerae bacterium]
MPGHGPHDGPMDRFIPPEAFPPRPPHSDPAQCAVAGPAVEAPSPHCRPFIWNNSRPAYSPRPPPGSLTPSDDLATGWTTAQPETACSSALDNQAPFGRIQNCDSIW